MESAGETSFEKEDSPDPFQKTFYLIWSSLRRVWEPLSCKKGVPIVFHFRDVFDNR